MSPCTPSWPQPSHPSLLQVINLPGSYSSFSRSLVSLPPGALLARLESPPLTFANKAYSTVQVSATQHIELNCDFLYTNHSCEPSVEFHVIPSSDADAAHINGKSPTSTKGQSKPPASVNGGLTQAPFAIEVRVARRKDESGKPVGLTAGEELTFFYPSTEWEMAQPFDCRCGAKTCAKRISGASEMGRHGLGDRFVNEHVLALLREIEQKEKEVESEGGKRMGLGKRELAGEMGGDTDA
ncbi:hypothetical protein MMC13_006219 [Lambiella insularis]|nr:hypothetical protein [Lambiella insularis]